MRIASEPIRVDSYLTSMYAYIRRSSHSHEDVEQRVRAFRRLLGALLEVSNAGQKIALPLFRPFDADPELVFIKTDEKTFIIRQYAKGDTNIR